MVRMGRLTTHILDTASGIPARQAWIYACIHWMAGANSRPRL